MIRARFTTASEDPRPVEWPIKHPYWITGENGHGNATVVAYADNLKEIIRLWPEANAISYTEVSGYLFTDRFERPEWVAEQ